MFCNIPPDLLFPALLHHSLFTARKLVEDKIEKKKKKKEKKQKMSQAVSPFESPTAGQSGSLSSTEDPRGCSPVSYESDSNDKRTWREEYDHMLDNAPDFTVEKLTFYEREKDHCRRLRAEHGVACLALLVSTQLYNDPEDPLPDDLITSHTRRLDETLEKVRKIHRADGVIRVRFFLLSFIFLKK